ncbi:MAG TPA: hypothetical protein VNO19_05345 [Gemmatimonadales bacterium]|nr:hypothetical protein [Gemmatimonadales bacterium]
MKILLAGLAVAMGLSACDSRRGEDTGRTESVDTTVTTRSTQDTTIISSDTTIHADTVHKEGELKRDTAKSH